MRSALCSGFWKAVRKAVRAARGDQKATLCVFEHVEGSRLHVSESYELGGRAVHVYFSSRVKAEVRRPVHPGPRVAAHVTFEVVAPEGDELRPGEALNMAEQWVAKIRELATGVRAPSRVAPPEYLRERDGSSQAFAKNPPSRAPTDDAGPVSRRARLAPRLPSRWNHPSRSS